MKMLILLFFISGVLQARTVVPSRLVVPNLNIFAKAKVLSGGSVRVKAFSYDENGNFLANKSTVTLSQEKYEKFKALAMPVFQMIPTPNLWNDRSKRRGTAFTIGENLVLTNAHVLDDELNRCADFQVTNNEGVTFQCKAVHHCDRDEDVCLIEMKPNKKTSLAQGPALKLKARFYPENPDQVITTAIGNSVGQGIHLSQGRGIERNWLGLLFWAPICPGNSGGALLNDEGLVIGIVKGESRNKIGESTELVFNSATDSETIIKVMRTGIHDPEILEKFNRSVVE